MKCKKLSAKNQLDFPQRTPDSNAFTIVFLESNVTKATAAQSNNKIWYQMISLLIKKSIV